MNGETWFRWAFGLILALTVSLTGFVLNKYADAFDRWADTVEKTSATVSHMQIEFKSLSQHLERLDGGLEKISGVAFDLPPGPTRERIEAIEDELGKRGYHPPHRKWR